MIVEIKNFGPIESFTFDLNKDLHFIIGENGVGKSYACYCIYLIIKNLNQWDYPENNWIKDDDENNPINQSSKKILNDFEKAEEIKITQEIEADLETLLSRYFIPKLQNSMLNTFSSLKNLENKNNDELPVILIKAYTYELALSINTKGQLFVKYAKINQIVKLIKSVEDKDRLKIFFNGSVWEEFHETRFQREYRYLVDSFLRGIYYIVGTTVKEFIFLPSSRSGLYQALNAFSPIIAELSQKRFLLSNKKIELPALTEPVSDYFIDLSTLNESNTNENLASIISDFELNIVKGKVRYDGNSNKIIFSPFGLDLNLNLSEASSMVAELSPVILFLKHVVNFKFRQYFLTTQQSDEDYLDEDYEQTKYSVFFIEELEAHLHPELQIKLMELLVNLMDNGIKIILTSHSDYMFNKLNNMILDHKVDPKRIGIYHMINTPKGSIVNPEVQATEDGMIDTNFAKSAEALFEERMEILERHNSTV